MRFYIIISEDKATGDIEQQDFATSYLECYMLMCYYTRAMPDVNVMCVSKYRAPVGWEWLR